MFTLISVLTKEPDFNFSWTLDTNRFFSKVKLFQSGKTLIWKMKTLLKVSNNMCVCVSCACVYTCMYMWWCMCVQRSTPTHPPSPPTSHAHQTILWSPHPSYDQPDTHAIFPTALPLLPPPLSPPYHALPNHNTSIHHSHWDPPSIISAWCALHYWNHFFTKNKMNSISFCSLCRENICSNTIQWA